MVDGTAFCPQCGAAIGAAAAPPPYPMQPAASGMQENVAGALCYVLGWLTGIIFLLIDKRPFVRFHAAQSIVVFGFLFLLRMVLSYMWIGGSYYGGTGFWGIHLLLSSLLGLVTLVAWIVLIIVAAQGKRFEVPGASGIAHSLAGKV